MATAIAPVLDLANMLALLDRGRQLNDRALALIDELMDGLVELRRFNELPTARVVHTYAGEGLTACGLEVVGPCPDCAAVAK